MDLKHRLLQESFGYTSFRPGQERLIDAMTAGQDVLGVMPTGAGKSICYQISAMLLPGITLVISPLISLMQDQVESLHRAGISSCFLNSSQTAEERRDAVQKASAGRCKLIYIAPERLTQDDFIAWIRKLPIAMIAVDEAHCISQWGHDFRPSYRKIPQFISSLPNRPVLSEFTATATAQVRKDIVQALNLQNPERLVTSFDRPNLRYEVRRVSARKQTLLAFIQKQKEASGIVYCLTRKQTEETAEFLRDHGLTAVAYHGGMQAMQRRVAQQMFLDGEAQIIAATNAFGMGIDKPDVRFVVHNGMPRDMESYYQEAGRAGRDGAPASCLLLFKESDISLHEYLIDLDPENPELTDEDVERLRKQNLSRLKKMKRYVFTEGCLRQYILRYFGQHDAADFCGWCGNCEASSKERDITIDAQKVLSCVYRVREQCDSDMICRILLGEAAEDLREAGYDALSTFGIMHNDTQEYILSVISHLLSFGYLVRQENPHIRLRLCASAKNVLFQREKVVMRVRVSPKEARLTRASKDSQCPELSKALRRHRQKVARLYGVPAYAVYNDGVLEQVVRKQPHTDEALCAIIGKSIRSERERAQMLRLIEQNTQADFSEKA